MAENSCYFTYKQPVLYNDAVDYFSEYEKELTACCIKDKGHGRIEKREYRLLTDISWLEQQYEWETLVHQKPIALARYQGNSIYFS